MELKIKGRVKEYAITDDVEILGHVVHGLDDIKQYVEMSLYKSFSRGEATKQEPAESCEVHVGEMWMPYPCFDSEDAMYENRTYQNYILRRRPITQEDMKRLSELPSGSNECRISDKVPLNMLPLLYYEGDGSTMILMEL